MMVVVYLLHCKYRPVRRRRIETTTDTNAIDINNDKGISAENISMKQLPSNNSGEHLPSRVKTTLPVLLKRLRLKISCAMNLKV